MVIYISIYSFYNVFIVAGAIFIYMLTSYSIDMMDENII